MLDREYLNRVIQDEKYDELEGIGNFTRADAQYY